MSDLNYSSVVRTAIPTESVIPIFDLKDFPTPEDGLILLEAKEYVLEGNIDIGDNTFKLPAAGTAKITARTNVNYVLSCSSSGCLFCDNAASGSIILQEISLSAPNCTIFDINGNGTNIVLFNNALILSTDTVGTIKNCALADVSGFQVLEWNQGLIIDNVSAAILRHGSFVGGNNQEGAVMLTLQGNVSGLTVYDTLLVTGGANESIFDFKNTLTYDGILVFGNLFNRDAGGSNFAVDSLDNDDSNIMFNSNVGFEDGYIDGRVYNNTNKNEIYTDIEESREIVTHSGYHRCAVNKSEDQEVPSGVWTKVAFDQEEYDVGDMHDNVTNNTRITIKKAGWYEIRYKIKHDTMIARGYESRAIKNNSVVLQGTCDVDPGTRDNDYGTLSCASHLYQFAVDDYIELQFYHDNVASQDIVTANTFFEIRRVH